MSFWKKEIIKSKEDLFGLDLGNHSVKIIQMKKRGKLDEIRSWGIFEVGSECIKDGRIIDKEKMSQIIQKALERVQPHKISTRKVVCSLLESKVFLRIISIPAMKKESVSEAVKWEMEANIPLSIDEVYYDWQLLDKKDKKRRILAVAVSREVVDEMVETLELAGLSVYALEMESVATARSLIPQEADSKEAFFIVDIGKTKTSFVISEGVVPVFTSSIPFSSFGITESISKGLGVRIEEAEKLKIQQGIEHSFQNSSVFGFVKPFLENLAVEIEKSIDFYQETPEKSKKITRIFLSGGGSNLRGLASYLTARLSKEVILGNPWTNFRFGNKLPIINKKDSACFSTAIGLALREIRYEDKC